MMPYREFSTPDDFKAALHGIDQLILDATERAYRRSQDEAKQREHDSEKKLGWQTELEWHSFQCFEVVHIASGC